MSIQNITISQFRNLSYVDLELSSGFNVLHGANGSGKTSFLEAIFYLSSGKSFRTRSAEHITQQNLPHFSVFSRVNKSGRLIPAGTQRFQNGEKKIRLDGESQSSYLEMARLLPILLVNTDEHQLVAGGPEHRRRFMNWGMFHVEQSFHVLWRRMQQAVRQRNCVLKNRVQRFELAPWTQELLSVSNVLDEMRTQYIEKLTPFFNELIALLLSEVPSITLAYQRGWKQEESLESVLNRSLSRDESLGYTQYGPHRADLVFKVGSGLAKDILSRGQQKLMIYALRLAQGILFHNTMGSNCIYLIDDLVAELDKEKRQKVVGVLKDLEAQVFITGVELSELSNVSASQETKLFHVEQGKIT